MTDRGQKYFERLIGLIFVFISLSLNAQVGGFLHLNSETFYTRNVNLSTGITYKNHKLGVFHQQAIINGENYRYIQRGITFDVYLGSIENIVYFYAGGRFGTANDKFVLLTPHLNVGWKVHKNIEIVNGFSTFDTRLTGSIGVRATFMRDRRDDPVHNKKGRTLQPSENNTTPKKRDFTHQD